MFMLSGRRFPVARAICVRYWWKSRYCVHAGSCRKGLWCAPLWWRTLFWGRVTYTTVIEAPTTSMVSMVPFQWWWRSPQRTDGGPSSWQMWLVRMAWCGEGSKSSRWFQMWALVWVDMPVWWSI